MMKNKIYMQIDGSTSGVAARCDNHKLCIVNCALLIFLFSFLWVGTISAQDNYTVLVKCPVVKVATICFTSTESYWHHRVNHTENHYARQSATSTSYITDAIKANYSTASKSTKTHSNTWSSSVSTTLSIGFADFNIGGMPSCMNVKGATMSWKNAQNSSHWFSLYGIGSIPAAASTNYLSTYLSVISYYGTANTSVSYVTFGSLPTTSFMPYNSYTTSGSGPHTIGLWNTGTYTDYSSVTQSSVSSTASTNTYSYRFFQSLTSARANGVTSMGMMFWKSGGGTAMPYYLHIPSNSLTLKVEYAAPWSCVLTPTVRPNTSSVCANDGVFTLSASQSYNSSYVSLSPTSWSWYSATASSGPYSPMGGTNVSTYAVTAPSNTGSIWYRYNQSVNFISNSTLETKSNTYSITYCKPGSIYISQCCTSLGGSPSFSATQVRDRSVNLEWSGMSNVDHFVIRYGVDGGVGFKEITVAGNATSKLIERLTNGRSYFFQIQAIGASGYCDTQLSTKTYLTPNCQ